MEKKEKGKRKMEEKERKLKEKENLERELIIEKERKKLEQTEKELLERRERERKQGRVVSERQKQIGIDFLRRVLKRNDRVAQLTTTNFSSMLCDGLS